ncbi:aminotransferase class IV [Streptacidiphilus sp. P02-A3a]|uniref:aminotransferase class IV n=1 Tax=Streptacidiphilus sp. P02-A3a TaxID=2704468 RepID=UPI0015FC5AAA|nr:aminotransferase class IV [Streptacidiphilus sp. P02-A3a]QMU69187.1 4-amino-4-deoxychorismate lyase [Streptacidiphilus sp. P02-A3a]
MRIWVNGALREPADATVSVLDRGFTVGDGVFETVKVVGGRTFALELHLDRLERSARALGLPRPDRELVRAACADVLAAEPVPLGRLRITCTSGPAPLGPVRDDAGEGAEPLGPTLVVAVGATDPSPPTAAVVTVPWTRNEHSAIAGTKATSYAENVVALARAHEYGANEAVFGNTAGQLCEGTASNVFVVLGGRLLTPPLSSGCLAGITRALALRWSDAEEADLPLSVLREADEVFLTGSLRDIQAVTRVDDRELPGAPGPVTAALAAVFAERAAADPEPR